jgi:putative spermidine/putrescine transport system substrate-binding protein
MRALRWIAVALLVSAGGAAFAQATLTVSTWGFTMDLLDKNITRPFEQKYNCRILYETGNNADRLTKLVARKANPNVDVVHFAGNFTLRAINEGLLAPYDPAKIPSLAELYDWAKDPLGGRYGIGYAVSSYGLFYRTDKVKEPVTSWADLWRQDLKGYVTLPDIATTNGPATIFMLARAVGGSIDNTDPLWPRLKELAGNLVTTYRNSSEMLTLVKQGEAWVGAYPSFSWGQLLDTKVPLKAVIPKEGLTGFQSIVSVVKGAKNPDLAYKYIDWILSEPVQTAEALDLVDSPTNRLVKVPPAIAAKLTYGDEVIKSLTFMDEEKVAKVLPDWIKRWNAAMAR